MKKKLETIWIITAWIMLLPLVLIFKLFKLEPWANVVSSAGKTGVGPGVKLKWFASSMQL